MSDINEISAGEIAAQWKRIDEHSDKITKLEGKVAEMPTGLLQQEVRLGELVRTAVAEGTKELNSSINGLSKQITEQIRHLESRVEKLEQAEALKALENQKQRELDRRENKRHAVKTVIAAVVGFFAALLLNNWVSVIIFNLTKGI